MKAFIVLLAVVASTYAEAEADPYLLYGGHYYGGWPHAWGGYALPGLTYATGAGPCTNAWGLAVPCAQGNPLVKTEARKKREAEADPKADPYLLYGGYGYPWAGYAWPGLTYATGAGPCTNNAGQAVPCALGHPLVKTAAVWGRKKREAEADPKADPYLLYGGYGYPYTYGAYAYPHVYAAPAVVAKPCTNVNGVAVPCAQGHPTIASVHLLGKRSADPAYFANVKAEVTKHEAEAVVPYTTYGAVGYGWPYGYGLVPTVATAKVPYTYTTVQHKVAPVENPADPTRPELVHTSKLGVCLNYLGFQVPC